MAGQDATRLGEEAARRLADTGRCRIEPGLSDAEFDRVQERFGFTFADDHRAFLAAGLPVYSRAGARRAASSRWPDWRGGDPAELRRQLDRPVEGVLYDVEHNDFWYGPWGTRPSPTAAAVEAARRHLAAAPAMVPVHAHRFLPAGRGTWGHPVLSIYQTDVIVYGADLADYLPRELGDGSDDTASGPPSAALVTVPFWRDLVS